MIVFVHAIEEENDRDAFASVVVMIAAEKETVGIFWIVVTKIEIKIEERLVRGQRQIAKLRAHHRRADDINVVWSGQVFVPRVCVAVFFAAADHVNIYLRDDTVQRNRWIVGEVARAPQTFLLAAMPNEQHRALRPR